MIDGLPDRLSRRIEITDDGHWLWTGEKDAHGYGVAYIGESRVRASRFVRNLLVGDVEVRATSRSDVLAVLCGERLCVHPEHTLPCKRSQSFRPAKRGEAAA